MFNKILIANRGEIACRVIKTAHRLGIACVAIYSSIERDSLHVSLADEAYCVGEAPSCESYLNIEAIIHAAIESGAEAIHPGYGFLSENADFAKACAKANIVFIGPSIHALDIMGSKQRAKQQLEHTAVPLTPGYHGLDQSDVRLLAESEKIGYPVLLKAASGGGGKGIRAVYTREEFAAALTGARRESLAYFADEIMLIEKLLTDARHIEIQIMADNHGEVVHLFERDCSIQRRHQKIIEEAPAPHLSTDLRQRMSNAAIEVARAIDYRGAGTVEFLVLGEHQFYFMEMNTRLQVEHPVTEMITQLDLVEWQLRIAAGEKLPLKQNQIKAQGHAIECRLYAEDPFNAFMPAIGEIRVLNEPVGAGIRIDNGAKAQAIISQHYDPMFAKLICWGETRDEARQRLNRALAQYYIGGIKTNIPFLQAIITHPMFIGAELSTNFLQNQSIEMAKPDPIIALNLAACFDYLQTRSQQDPLLIDTFAWQMHLTSHWTARYLIDGMTYSIEVTPIDANTVQLQHDNTTRLWRIHLDKNQLKIDDGSQQHHAYVEQRLNECCIYHHDGSLIVEKVNEHTTSIHANQTANSLTAPMPATVVAIPQKKGARIKAGDCLMILEAMKMEHTITAPTDGLLVDIFYDIGTQVNEGAQLVSLEIDKP